MGGKIICCLNKQNSNDEPDILPDPSIKFVSFIDHQVYKFERENNFLNLIETEMFLEYLINFRCTNESNYQVNDNHDEIDENKYEVFVENKIIKSPIILLALGFSNDEIAIRYFSFLKSIFPILISNYLSFKKKNNEPFEDIISLNKSNLFAIGFSFCKSENRSKINTIFNIFSKSGYIQSTARLREFLYILFILNSKVYIKCIQNFFSREEIFSDAEMSKISEKFNVVNIIKFTDDFLGKIFQKNKSLSSIEFFSIMSKNLWICYGNGIRYKISKKMKLISNN